MTVEQFKLKEKPAVTVWQCNCGCENFWLYGDGRVECAECNTFHNSITGLWKIIDPTGPISFREVKDAVANQEAGEDDGSSGA